MTAAAPCTVRLEVFEGPLDLLLHLIKRDEVQITDIPIARITDEYLATLEAHPELNLDGAGEYLVMAATLMLIKSRMLLPEPAGSDEDPDEDPRAELVKQLLEYQRFREAAVALGDRPVLARDVFAGPGLASDRPSADDAVGPPVREASLGALLEAFRDLLERRRPPPQHEVSGAPTHTIADRVQAILGCFAVDDEVEFTSLFAPEASRGEIIVTFLALLELIKLCVVRATQSERFGAITLGLAVADLGEAARRVQDVGRALEWRGGGIAHGDGRTERGS
jgi:segregation and condensation protein A